MTDATVAGRAGRQPPPAGAPEDVLAIVGATTFMSPIGLRRASDIIGAVLKLARPDKVIFEDAGGVAALAEQAAMTRGIPTREYVPTSQPRRWAGPGGLQENNIRIVCACTRLVYIACTERLRYSANWTAELAEREGRPVEPFFINPDGKVTREPPLRRSRRRPATATPTPAGPPAPPEPRWPAPAPPAQPEPELAAAEGKPLEEIYEGVSNRWLPKPKGTPR